MRCESGSAKGKYKTYKYKTTYGAKYTSQIRKGEWQFFNEEGAKIAFGNYKIDKEFSTKDGEWLFYNSNNILIYKRWYNKGIIQKTQFFDTGKYCFESDTVSVFDDSMGDFNIEEKKGAFTYQYQVSKQQIIMNFLTYHILRTFDMIYSIQNIVHYTCDFQTLYKAATYLKMKSLGFGVKRCLYELNRYLPCLSLLQHKL